MKLNRLLRYTYLRFVRLRGTSHELALGMAFGIFTGSMPIMPFQVALAVALAVFFKGSKITAVLGTWISNPLNWGFLYFYSYKIGAFLLGLPERNTMISSIMEGVRAGEKAITIVEKILGAGGFMIAAFLLGGLILGLLFSIPSYFIFLNIFQYVASWRKSKRERRKWHALAH